MVSKLHLGNFGPEISETMLAQYFDGPKMFVAAAESKSARACNITPKFSGVMAASVLNARKAVICLVMFVVFIS